MMLCFINEPEKYKDVNVGKLNMIIKTLPIENIINLFPNEGTQS